MKVVTQSTVQPPSTGGTPENPKDNQSQYYNPTLFEHVLKYSLVAIWKMAPSMEQGITAGTDLMDHELQLDEKGQSIMIDWNTQFTKLTDADVQQTQFDESNPAGDKDKVTADVTTYGFHNAEQQAMSTNSNGIHEMLTTGTGTQNGNLQQDVSNAQQATKLWDMIGQIHTPS